MSKRDYYEGLEGSNGASEAELSGFNGERLTITASGATEIDGEDGRYAALALNVSGAGDVDLRDVVATDARVTLSGAGEIKVGMNGGILSGSLSGAGNIEYYGTISENRVSIAGFGRVDQAN